MNKIFLFLFLSLIAFCARAQKQKDWDAFYQRIEVSNYRGMKFKMTAAVKANVSEKNSKARLWCRVDNKNGTQGFFYNMDDRPVRTNKWKQYSIEGRIDDSAKYLFVGGIVSGNGEFSFDDFSVQIKTPSNIFSPDILNAGFEGTNIHPWKFFSNLSVFATEINGEGAFAGRHFLKVTGTGIKAAKLYGNNDSASRVIKVNGVKIYYEEYGSGEPLLLLHGNSQSIESFSKQIPAFSPFYRVIAVDTRGHGRSSDQGRRFTYDLFAEDMKALLDKLNLDSVNVLGWSDGGNTGLIMAMKYPKKVKRLITMGAVVFIDSTVVTQQTLDEVAAELIKMKKEGGKTAGPAIKKTTLLLEEPNYKFEDLHAIVCPVLVMAGEKDIVKAGHTKGIAANIPEAELLIVPKRTHYLPEEAPELFNKEVLSFLRK